MASPLDKQVLYVTGKGGVGRSTVAGALGIALSRRGRRTIVCEVSGQDRLARAYGVDTAGDDETQLDDCLWGISIDPWAALHAWLGKALGSGRLARLLFDNNAFQYFTAAAPGAREMASIVKVWELAQRERWKGGAEGYDSVIVDAPASGHGIGMLRTPRTFANLARVGPIHSQSERVGELLRDKRRTGYLAVALAEEMPVNETLELQRALPGAVGAGLDAVVVNGLYPKRFSAADVERFAGGNDRRPDTARALAAARTEHNWARGQQSQLGRLRRGIDAPVVTLPFVFEPALGIAELEHLAHELDRKL